MYTDHTLNSVFAHLTLGTKTRKQAAEILGVSERQVNRLMKAAGVERPEGAYRRAREAAKEHRQVRDTAAQKAIDKKISVKQAALNAGVSMRTIYRRLKKMKNG